MSSTQRKDARDDNLADSWVELQYQGQVHQLAPPVEPPYMSKPLSHGTMEKLLLEAQKEWSRTSSRMGSNVGSTTSSRGSPRSPSSPNNELSSMGIGEISTIQEGRVMLPDVPTDWLWDWSRADMSASGEWNGSKSDKSKRSSLSIRNTKVMRSGPFSLENLPIMLLTHACTFFFGAAVMFVYLKKYCGWSSVARTTIVD